MPETLTKKPKNTKKPLKVFRVFISQVNETYYDIEAGNEEVAVTIAAHQWVADLYPTIISVETQND